MKGKMKSIYVYLLVVFLSGSEVFAQKMRPIGKGDTLPTIALKQVINYTDSTVYLNAFKGKAILIDFWATWCGPCVKAIPNLQRLQRKYGQDLQVITISTDKKDIVQSFFSKIGGDKLLTATGDNNEWQQLFPHRFIPHEIWIDKDGKVKGVSDELAVTDDNIEKLIRGESLNFVASDTAQLKSRSLKQEDKPIDYNVMSLLEAKNLGGIESFSAFCHYIPGKRNAVIVGPKYINGYPLKDRRFYAWNVSPVVLYKTAFGYEDTGEMYSSGRVIFEINDQEKKAIFTRNMTATDSNLVSYSILLPKNTETPLYRKVQSDLQKYFGVRGVFEWRKVSVFSLEIRDKSKLTTTGGKETIEATPLYYIAINSPLESLVQKLSFYNENFGAIIEPKRKIIVGGAGMNIRADIDLKTDLRNIEEVNRQLKIYGLVLKQRTKEIKMLVLKDN